MFRPIYNRIKLYKRTNQYHIFKIISKLIFPTFQSLILSDKASSEWNRTLKRLQQNVAEFRYGSNGPDSNVGHNSFKVSSDIFDIFFHFKLTVQPEQFVWRLFETILFVLISRCQSSDNYLKRGCDLWFAKYWFASEYIFFIV